MLAAGTQMADGVKLLSTAVGDTRIVAIITQAMRNGSKRAWLLSEVDVQTAYATSKPVAPTA